MLQRGFTDAYDYNRRRLRRDIIGDTDAAMAFLARLRLDAVLYDKIVISDVQLFHSLAFSSLVHCKILKFYVKELLPFDRLEIVMRGATLAESLIMLVRGHGDGKLRDHLFTFIDHEGAIAPQLRRIPEESVREWKDVIRVLSSIGGDPIRDVLEQSESAWS